ncbi:MAG: universal stress protein [Rudaea sp.]
MREILALANKYGCASRNMAYAGELALAIQGSLTGLFVSESVSSIGVAISYPEFETIEADLASEAAEAAPMFERWARELGVLHYRWQVARGSAQAVLARLANWHDFLILEKGENVPPGTPLILGKILLTAGVTCIVVPEKSQAPAVPGSVAIAWNGTPEAMRAVRAALPLLECAKNVLLIDGEGAATGLPIAWHPPLDVDRYLEAHAIRFERTPFEANRMETGRGLLRLAEKASADLLVMGAYGYSRYEECIFGGATEYVLRNGELPVLFRH